MPIGSEISSVGMFKNGRRFSVSVIIPAYLKNASIPTSITIVIISGILALPLSLIHI